MSVKVSEVEKIFFWTQKYFFSFFASSENFFYAPQPKKNQNFRANFFSFWLKKSLKCKIFKNILVTFYKMKKSLRENFDFFLRLGWGWIPVGVW